MSWNRCAALALLLFAPASAWAGTFQCPAAHEGAALTSVDLYDGPVDEHADLAPDHSSETRRYQTARWDVGYIRKAGRQLFVDCQYGKKHLVVKPPPEVQRCVYRVVKHGITSLKCT